MWNVLKRKRKGKEGNEMPEPKDFKDPKAQQDPNLGDGDPTPPIAPEGYVLVPKDTMDKLNRLDFTNSQGQFVDQQNIQSSPKEDPYDKEIEEIDTTLQSLDDQIDKAEEKEDLKAVRTLERKRYRLSERKQELRSEQRISVAERNAAGVITKLTSQISQQNMPYLKIPEVKDAYEASLNSLDVNFKMTPEGQMAAYNHAVGSNMTKILEVEKEEFMRAQDDINVNDVSGGGPGRGQGGAGGGGSGDDQNPTFEEYFGPGAVQAITEIGQTIEQYCRRRGFDTAQAYTDHIIEIEKETKGGMQQ